MKTTIKKKFTVTPTPDELEQYLLDAHNDVSYYKYRNDKGDLLPYIFLGMGRLKGFYSFYSSDVYSYADEFHTMKSDWVGGDSARMYYMKQEDWNEFFSDYLHEPKNDKAMKVIDTLFTPGQPIGNKKSIEFVRSLNNDMYNIMDSVCHTSSEFFPANFDNIRLISSGEKFDVIAAWNNTEDLTTKNVCVFLGHWNDGVL